MWCADPAVGAVGHVNSPPGRASTRSTSSAECSLGGMPVSPPTVAMPMGDTATRRPERIDYEWVYAQHELDAVLDVLIASGRYALDTEFHRERTYYPKLALIQVAWLDP